MKLHDSKATAKYLQPCPSIAGSHHSTRKEVDDSEVENLPYDSTGKRYPTRPTMGALMRADHSLIRSSENSLRSVFLFA